MGRLNTNKACLFSLLLQASLCFFVHGSVMVIPPLASTSMDVSPEVETPTDGDLHSKQVIESFHVQTDIRYRFATTKMCSVVRNTAGTAHEMTFGITLPKEAFIVSFAMTIDGKVYDGEVKEKKAAKEQYNKAVERGQSAGHIRQTPRHSNRFDMSVNVANGTAVNFTLTYQQILSRRLGLYEYEMHVEPGQAVRDFNLEVFIQENRPLLFVKTPQLRKASIIDNSVEVSNDLTTVDRPTETTAHIQYKPSITQQGKDGIAARFVVQYDVEHSDNGDVLVADGYFLHLFSPKPRSSLPKDIIFVLDVSGSMSGNKISQLKDAMKTILGDLTEDDRFNILTFNGKVSQWKPILAGVMSRVVDEAKQFVNSMVANGGTNINDALLSALSELQGREVQNRVGMIFFLTDGEATVGETNTAKIARNVKSKNVAKTSIYSLAFGQGANFESLKTISTQNYGYARKIYEASDAALQVESLYNEISTVAMKNVSVKYLPSVIKTTDTVFPIVQNGSEIMIGGCIDTRLLRERFDLLEEDVEVDTFAIFEAEINGIEKEGNVDIILEIDDINDVTINPDDSLNSFFTMPRDFSGIVEKMWAFLTIKQMLREKQGAVEDKTKVEELNKKILEMSLKYKFVTPMTSMVVSKPDTDTPVESGLEDVDNLPIPPSSLQNGLGISYRRGTMGPSYSYAMNRASMVGNLLPRHPSRHPNGMIPPVAVPGLSIPKTKFNKKSNQRKSKGRRRGRGKKGNKTPSIGILRSVVLRTDQTSVCVELKKIPADRYLIAQVDTVANVTKGFKAELVTSCLRKCRFVVPDSLDLTSGRKTTNIDLTSLGSWRYQQHSDFDVTLAKMNEIRLEHESVVVTIVRTLKGKSALFSVDFQLKSGLGSSSSAMTDILMKPLGMRRRRKPKACVHTNVDISMFMRGKKAQKFKV